MTSTICDKCKSEDICWSDFSGRLKKMVGFHLCYKCQKELETVIHRFFTS